MNGAPGIRTPGRSSDVAKSPAIVQRTMEGSVNTSRRKPKPGTWTVNPNGCGSTSASVTSSTSPGSAPLTYTGPVSGCTTPRFALRRSSAVVAGVTKPSNASRVSSPTICPGSTSASGGMSGCQRLWPLAGSSARVFVRSMARYAAVSARMMLFPLPYADVGSGSASHERLRRSVGQPLFGPVLTVRTQQLEIEGQPAEAPGFRRPA